MASKGEACDECTLNCLKMHKREKNPSSVATTFVKVMFGAECSKVLFLPPRFAHSVQKKAGKSTWLEDSTGEKWKVRFTKINDLLAIEEGWNTFWLQHGLKVGDTLVFHYIMESHFVVSMYGESGCPEIRHCGFTRHPMKKTRKERKSTIVDNHIPSNVITNGHHPETEDSVDSQQKETRTKKKRTYDTTPPNVSTANTHDHFSASSSRSQPSDLDKETSKRSKPLVKTNPHHLVASSSRSQPSDSVKQTSQRSKPLVKTNPDNLVASSLRSQPSDSDKQTSQRSKPLVKTNPDNLVAPSLRSQPSDLDKETSQRSKPLVKTNPDNLVAPSSRSQPSDSDKETSQRSKPLVKTYPDNMVCETPTNVKKNHSVYVEDFEDEDFEDEDLGVNGSLDVSIPEISPKKSPGGRKNDTVARSGGDETKIKESAKVLETPFKKITEKPKESSIKKRSSSTMLPMTPSKIVKREPVLTTQTDFSGSKLCNDGCAPASPGPFSKPKDAPPNTIKKEPISAREDDTSGSRFHNADLHHKPIDEPKETPKNNPTMNHESTGAIKTNSGAKTDFHYSLKEENNDILPKVKLEPVDYDESPSAGSTDTSFSAVMSSFDYLELPKSVKFKSKEKVILLRNKADLWPVLYQNKVGLKALTQSWEAFARQRGIQLGDKCDFVLEREANSKYTCSVFKVQVTRI